MSTTLRFFWRHKGKMTIVFSMVVGTALFYLATAPRKYLSEAKLYVRLGRESVALDPTATTGQIVTSADSRESEINAIVELFASRAMAERIVDQFGPRVILEKKSDGPPLGERLAFLDGVNLNPLKVYSIKDKAVAHFQEHLGVRSGKRTNVISVSFEAQDPTLAHEVVDSLLKLGRDDYLRMNRTKGSHEFFDQQATQLKLELETLEAKRRDLKNETGLASLTQQRELALKRIGELEDRLVLALAEEDSVAAEVKARREQLAKLPQMVVTQQVSGQPNTPEFAMRERLYELEIKEAELASKLTDIAPQLIQVRQQIADAREILDDEDAKVEITRAVNKAHEASELALQESSIQLVAYQARTASLEEKIADAKTTLKKINDHEVQIAQVERAIELSDASYRKYADNVEQSRIDQALELAKISSLNPLQLPSVSETPVSPKPVPVLGLAVVLAGLASLGVALLADRRAVPRTFQANGQAVHANGDSHPDVSPVEPDLPDLLAQRGEDVPANPR